MNHIIFQAHFFTVSSGQLETTNSACTETTTSSMKGIDNGKGTPDNKSNITQSEMVNYTAAAKNIIANPGDERCVIKVWLKRKQEEKRVWSGLALSGMVCTDDDGLVMTRDYNQAHSEPRKRKRFE
ncbi:hypothetical protein Trydic_g4623 [Trypoxylus dichotomus]